jgi:MipA family protein
MFLRTLLLATAATAVSTAAAAQSQPYERVLPQSDGWTGAVGAGVIFSQDANGDTGGQTTPVVGFVASWRDTVYVNPFDGLGWNVVNQDRFRAGVQLRPRFGAEDIEDLELDRPGFGADAAVYAYGRLPGNIVVGGRVSQEITDEADGGLEYSASVGHQRVTPIGLATVSAFVRGGDDKLARAYYGVSAAEAVRNGIAAYDPDGGLEAAGVNLILVAPLGERWGVGGLVGWERRLGDAADSPLSRNDDGFRGGLFVARRFGG